MLMKFTYISLVYVPIPKYELMILIIITDAHRFWRTTMFNDMVIRRITMFFSLIYILPLFIFRSSREAQNGESVQRLN